MENTPRPESTGKPVWPTKPVNANVTPAKPAATGAAPIKPAAPMPGSVKPFAAPDKAAPYGGVASPATPATTASVPVAAAKPTTTAATRAANTTKPATAAKLAVIEAKIDVGFGNKLYLRGQGGGLSWDTGIPLTCVNDKTWRLSIPCTEKLTFKLLLNDSVWAQGKDLMVSPGQTVEVVPAF